MIRIPHESGRPVAVLGLGNSGLTAARALAASGADVWAWDDDAAKRTQLATTDLYACDWTRPSALVLSTRIVLIRYPTKDGENHLLALVAERATDMLERNPSDFTPSGMEAGTPPYLGPVASDDKGLVQWVKVEALLSDDIRDTLFRQVAMSS